MKRSIKDMRSAYIIGGIVLVIAIVWACIAIFSHSEGPSSGIFAVTRGNIIETVTADSTVKPTEDVDLAFEGSGRVASIGADVGTHVAKGAMLVSLDASDLVANRAEKEADAETAEAQLAQLETGTRPEDIAVAEAKSDDASAAVAAAQKALSTAISAAYTSADDAILNKTDVLFVAPQSDTPQFINMTVPDSALVDQAESERLVIKGKLAAWDTLLAQLSGTSDIHTLAATSEDTLSYIISYLSDLATITTSAISNGSYPQSSLDAFKAAVSSARTNMSAAISSVTGADGALKTAETSLGVAQDELASTKAGATQSDLDAQKARVASAQAAVDALDAEIAKTVIRSPINGVVSRQDAKVGEIVSPGAPLVSVISDNQFELEAYIPENDIAKVAIGQSASTTLDAYGDSVVFPAAVTKIDPAQTVQNGSPAYKVTLAFTAPDSRIKSGMTANVTILTKQENNALIVPSRSVFKNGDQLFVMAKQGDAFVQKSVTAGIAGSDGMTEITSGLSEGDEIQAFSN